MLSILKFLKPAFFGIATGALIGGMLTKSLNYPDVIILLICVSLLFLEYILNSVKEKRERL